MINKLFILLIGIAFVGCDTQKEETNIFQVVTEDLDINSLQIYWTTEKGFAEREGEQDSVLVFTDGEYLKNIGNVYGGNGFYIYYKDSCIGNVGHFKERNSDVHNYLIDVKQNLSIEFKAIIIDAK